MGHLEAHSSTLGRCADGPTGIALPGLAPAGQTSWITAEWADTEPRAQRQVLFAHARGKATTRARAGELATAVVGRRTPAQKGLSMVSSASSESGASGCDRCGAGERRTPSSRRNCGFTSISLSPRTSPKACHGRTRSPPRDERLAICRCSKRCAAIIAASTGSMTSGGRPLCVPSVRQGSEARRRHRAHARPWRRRQHRRIQHRCGIPAPAAGTRTGSDRGAGSRGSQQGNWRISPIQVLVRCVGGFWRRPKSFRRPVRLLTADYRRGDRRHADAHSRTASSPAITSRRSASNPRSDGSSSPERASASAAVTSWSLATRSGRRGSAPTGRSFGQAAQDRRARDDGNRRGAGGLSWHVRRSSTWTDICR